MEQCRNGFAVSAALQRALALLLDAAKYAARTKSSRWEFAVEIGELQNLDVSKSDLRYLLQLRLVASAEEITFPGHAGRTFRINSNLSFSNRTCFALTPRGLAVAIGHNLSAKRIKNRGVAPSGQIARSAQALPHWDAKRCVLCIGNQVVKHFKANAANQTVILTAFHEEGWPSRIDDPLSPSPETDSKRRLNDAIKSLNRNQANNLIRFRGDGTGQGVVWEPVTAHLKVAVGPRLL